LSTFAGIRPLDAPGFILALLIGAGLTTALDTWLYGRSQPATSAPAGAEHVGTAV
jgi:hypothetical protein